MSRSTSCRMPCVGDPLALGPGPVEARDGPAGRASAWHRGGTGWASGWCRSCRPSRAGSAARRRNCRSGPGGRRAVSVAIDAADLGPELGRHAFVGIDLQDPVAGAGGDAGIAALALQLPAAFQQRAPWARAISALASVLRSSTTTTSSAPAEARQAGRQPRRLVAGDHQGGDARRASCGHLGRQQPPAAASASVQRSGPACCRARGCPARPPSRCAGRPGHIRSTGEGPNRPRVGVPVAAERCISPLSLPTKMAQRASTAAASGRARRADQVHRILAQRRQHRRGHGPLLRPRPAEDGGAGAFQRLRPARSAPGTGRRSARPARPCGPNWRSGRGRSRPLARQQRRGPGASAGPNQATGSGGGSSPSSAPRCASRCPGCRPPRMTSAASPAPARRRRSRAGPPPCPSACRPPAATDPTNAAGSGAWSARWSRRGSACGRRRPRPPGRRPPPPWPADRSRIRWSSSPVESTASPIRVEVMKRMRTARRV